MTLLSSILLYSLLLLQILAIVSITLELHQSPNVFLKQDTLHGLFVSFISPTHMVIHLI